MIARGDARNLPLADTSVDLVVTSPPYYALRSYTDGGEHYDGQIGSEKTPAEYVDNLIACTREWTRVLKPSGSIFVNLGDPDLPNLHWLSRSTANELLVPLGGDGARERIGAYIAAARAAGGELSEYESADYAGVTITFGSIGLRPYAGKEWLGATEPPAPKRRAYLPLLVDERPAFEPPTCVHDDLDVERCAEGGHDQ